jgi:hypothetical protein
MIELEVYYKTTIKVGTLFEDESGTSYFEYDPDWIMTGIELSL